MGKLGVQGFDSRTFMVCWGWQYRRYASIQAGISLGLWVCLTLWTLVASGVTPYNKSVFILPGQDQPRPPFPGKTKNTHALFTQTQAAVQNQVHARPSQQKRRRWWKSSYQSPKNQSNACAKTCPVAGLILLKCNGYFHHYIITFKTDRFWDAFTAKAGRQNIYKIVTMILPMKCPIMSQSLD